MKGKWILLICVVGFIVFVVLSAMEFATVGKAVEKSIQAVKNAVEHDSLLNRLKKENIRIASTEIADQVVTQLPDNIHFRLLAIGPISGESGSLTDALTANIKSQTQFHLIERKDLNRLLEEQGIQLSPISDPRRPIEPGRIKGVEGLILGRLGLKHASFMWCSLEAFIKLDDVEGGDVVFAETFYARHIPKHTTYGGMAIVFLILLIFCANRLKVRKEKMRFHRVDNDADRLLSLQDSLKKSRENLNRAHDILVTTGKMDAGMAVRQCRDDVKHLLDAVEHTPGLHADLVTTRDHKSAKSHSKSMRNLIRNVLSESEKIFRAAGEGDARRVITVADRLCMEAKNALNRFRDRNIGNH